MKSNEALAPFERALGTWAVTGSHPLLPDRTVRGQVTFERIEGGAFVRMHSKVEDPAFPEGVAIFGTDADDASCTMLYFDDRGVSRRYDITFQREGFTWSRDEPKFAQRYVVTFGEGGRTMEGQGTMKREGKDWEPDLRLSYARVP